MTNEAEASRDRDATPSAPEKEGKPVQIMIKNPTDGPSAAPFTLSLQPETTIGELKARLSTTYPGSPAASTQRLIYAGKLLSDCATLLDTISDAQPAMRHTIHLVVSTPLPLPRPPTASTSRSFATPPASSPSPAASSPSPAAPSAAPSSAAAAAAPPPTGAAPTTPFVYPYAYPYYPPSFYSGTPPPNYPPMYPPFPLPPPPPSDPSNPPPPAPDHVAYATHLQAIEHLISQYLQNAPPSATPPDPATRAHLAAHLDAAAAAIHAHAAAHPRPAHPPTNLPFHLRLPPNPPPPPHQQHQQQQPESPGAEPQQRVRQFVFHFEFNWSLVFKLLFLVYLLGQEGSPRRVYTLLSIAVAVYLWHTGHLTFVRRIIAIILPHPRHLIDTLFPPTNSQQQQNQHNNSTPSHLVVQQRTPNRFGRVAVILSLLYSFVYGFFCSLLPAWRVDPLPRVEDMLPNPNHNHPHPPSTNDQHPPEQNHPHEE